MSEIVGRFQAPARGADHTAPWVTYALERRGNFLGDDGGLCVDAKPSADRDEREYKTRALSRLLAAAHRRVAFYEAAIETYTRECEALTAEEMTLARVLYRAYTDAQTDEIHYWGGDIPFAAFPPSLRPYFDPESWRRVAREARIALATEDRS